MKLIKIVTPVVLLGLTQFTFADGNFKRFSVSAGWMHVMPQGKANPFNIRTAVSPVTTIPVGTISLGSLLGSIDGDAQVPGLPEGMIGKDILFPVFEEMLDQPDDWYALGFLDEDGNLVATESGDAEIRGLDQWTNQGTGLEADDVDTLGLTFNYYINDNVSLQMIGGIPPKVDIKGVGIINAPLSGTAILPPTSILQIAGISEFELAQAIEITNLGARKKASTARAWTPALEVQYQFGKSGVNKFRPYVGAGIMYAYFNEIKLDKGIEADLQVAGHMIQNMLDGKGGAALDRKVSTDANGDAYRMKVDVDTDTAIAPIVTAGFTYDITPSWYGVASVSYAKLNNQATIKVLNETTGQQMIHSSTKVDIDPLITYLGVGYRF